MKRIIISIVCLLCGLATWAFDQQEALKNLYNRLSLTGNTMPAGEGDIAGIEETMTDLVRGLITLNELTTDVVYTFWNDSGLPALALGKPESDNPFVLAMYRRLEYNIRKCNEFLDNTSDSDEDSKLQRAEARFLRALYYSFAIDLWGDMPLWKTSSDNPQTRTSRREVFEWVVQELESCAENMSLPESSQYGRADKVAAWLLLSRLYLNAEVYAGEAQWQLAKDYAQLVIDSGYSLCNQYIHLFMGDNDWNGAQSEIILPAVVDGQTQYSYGNTMFLIAATHSHEMPSCGIDQWWGGYYARDNLLEKFFPDTDAPHLTTGMMVSSAQDDRCLFYGVGRLSGTPLGRSFFDGYSIDKFTNNCAYGASSSASFPDTDFPLLRMAEAYLCYAEADAHLNGGTCSGDGLDKLNILRLRANAMTFDRATLGDVADEWCREFYMEGRRRMDLVRLNLYSGDSYQWTGKGDLLQPTALSPYRCLMPMPDDILIEHPQYTQNTGYDDPNFVPDELVLNTPAFGSDIVDLKEIKALWLNWQRPQNLPEGGKISVSLELSTNPEFMDPKIVLIPDEDSYGVLVNASELNRFLLSVDSKAFDYTSVCVYARCLTRTATSNTVVLEVKPYDNTYEQMPQPWYFVGNCIGDGQWGNSFAQLGTSMFPMNLNSDGSSVFTGYFQEGDSFVMVSKPGSWNDVVRSDDGSPYSLFISGWGDNISIYEKGWYTFHVHPQWNYAYGEKVSDEEWPLYGRMMLASGFRGSDITAMTACNPSNPYNHIWFARVVFDTDDTVQFLLNGKETEKVGGIGFPFGYATETSGAVPVKAGDYVVFFDDMTGYYQFTDATTGLLPEQFVSYHRNLQVIPEDVVHLVNVTTETIKICGIDLGLDSKASDICLHVGNQSFEMNELGEVDADIFIKAMIDQFGQYGLHTIEATVSLESIDRDLVYSFVSDPFVLTLQMLSIPIEQHYFYIGNLTNWDFYNQTMPLTCLSGNQWVIDPRFQIDIVAPAGMEDFFSVFPESATADTEPWSCTIRPVDLVDPSSEGSFSLGGNNGSWHIPSAEIDKTYRLTLDFNLGTYSFIEVPAISTTLTPLPCDNIPSHHQVYDLYGRLIPHEYPRTSFSKGLYIINNRKVIIQ